MSECDLLYKRRSCEHRVVRAPLLKAAPLADSHIISQSLTDFRTKERLHARSPLKLWFCCRCERSTTENSSLRRLGLADNSFDEIGAYHLSEAILIYLDLSHNEIGDAGASSISTALPANSSLTHLDLSANNLRRWCLFPFQGPHNKLLLDYKLGFH